MSNKKIERIKELVEEIRGITGKLNVNLDLLLLGEMKTDKIAPQVDKFAKPLIVRVLNDVEEVHHAACMAGDMMYMQKLGTILERYKEVRKDDVGG